MTTREKLDVIVKDIREKLPRLMELEEGCLVKIENDKFLTDGVWQIVNVKKDKKNKYSIIHKTKNENILSSFYFSDNFSIIGKEPMLTDVLEWSKTTKYFKDNYFEELYTDSEGYFYIRDYNTEYEVLYNTEKNIKWDLSRPYLKDQSEELIDFLYSLLKF